MISHIFVLGRVPPQGKLHWHRALAQVQVALSAPVYTEPAIRLGRFERSPFGSGFCRKMQHAEAMSRMQSIVRPTEQTKIRGIAPPLARKRNDVIDLQKCAFIAAPPVN